MTPDVGELCVAGERAFENDEFEEAEAWYELACRGSYKTVYVRGDTRAIAPHPHETLISNRFARWEQLRAMTRQRSARRLAKPDPNHLLLVMTCRGREAFFGPLWERMQDEWFDDILVAAVMDTTGAGQAKTFFRALQLAVDYVPNLTALTLLEDDVVLAENALDYIATTKIDDDLAFISWFSVDHYSGPRLSPTLDCIPARDYMFNQAITFPARTVHELLASDALKNWSELHGADRIYKDVFPDRLVAVHYPNLVQHVGGTQSLVGNNSHGLRTSPTFIGQDADALALVR